MFELQLASAFCLHVSALVLSKAFSNPSNQKGFLTMRSQEVFLGRVSIGGRQPEPNFDFCLIELIEMRLADEPRSQGGSISGGVRS